MDKKPLPGCLRQGSGSRAVFKDKNGAGDGVRTRDPKLGKLVLYQLSYARFFEKDYIGMSSRCQLKNWRLQELFDGLLDVIFIPGPHIALPDLAGLVKNDHHRDRADTVLGGHILGSDKHGIG